MHVARKKALDGEYDDDETWDLNDPEFSFAVWRMLDGIEWKLAPDVLLDQDEALMEDLATISYMSQMVEALVDQNRASGADAAPRA